jgi:peptidoglycan/LPS O-acetylase OafA/YrhL
MTSFSIEDKLRTSNFRPSGFDYLRIGLSVSVVLWHSFGLSYGRDFTSGLAQSPFRGVVILILPMFFALSGFLVAGSLLRCKTLLSFLGLRAIRIVPALVVETLISAYLVGAIFTTLPLTSYFSHAEFYRYMLNIVGIVQFTLPGVFVANPFSNIVNGQLWTVPYELECYIALSIFAIIGLTKRRYLILVGLAGLMVLVALLQLRSLYLHGVEPVHAAVTGRQLIIAFIAGVAGFFYRDRIPYHPIIGLSSLCLAYLTFVFAPWADLIGVVFASYFTIWLGSMNPKKIFILNGADYSYGIFLYGFVIQQAVKSVFPELNWLGNFALSLLVVSVAAALSWHFIEKPALKSRNALMRAEEAYILFKGSWLSKFSRRFKTREAPNL